MEPSTAGKRKRTRSAVPDDACAVKKARADVLEDLGPYPKHAKPSTEECRAVHAALSLLHPEAAEKKQSDGGCGKRKLVLDALVGTILSQNTTDVNSQRAFSSLKAAFPTWEEVLAAPSAEIEEAIRSGGLAATKTERIKAILQTLRDERGEISLEHLRAMDDATVKAALKKYKGVGDKTISCVLLFCLMRADFPVDTHVWKIALALKWVPSGADRDGTYAHLNRIVPDDIKYALHVLLVAHGKAYKNDVKVLREALRQAEHGAPLVTEEPLQPLLDEPSRAAEEPPAEETARGVKAEPSAAAVKTEPSAAAVKTEPALPTETRAGGARGGRAREVRVKRERE